jgi:hypothetical protein
VKVGEGLACSLRKKAAGELVVTIAEELVESRFGQEDTVALALTCRALEDPALSVLWAKQTTLGTLIRVLPQDTLACTWRERPIGDIYFVGEGLVRACT